MPLLSTELSQISVSLSVDAMYLSEAEKALDRAVKGWTRVERGIRKTERLRNRQERIVERHGGDTWRAYDDLEPVCIQLENAEYELGVAYAPVLRSIAVVHVMAAAS